MLRPRPVISAGLPPLLKPIRHPKSILDKAPNQAQVEREGFRLILVAPKADASSSRSRPLLHIFEIFPRTPQAYLQTSQRPKLPTSGPPVLICRQESVRRMCAKVVQHATSDNTFYFELNPMHGPFHIFLRMWNVEVLNLKFTNRKNTLNCGALSFPAICLEKPAEEAASKKAFFRDWNCELTEFSLSLSIYIYVWV